MANAPSPAPAKKTGPASGVLPISASTLQKNVGGKDASRRSAREQGPRLKVVIRRLPPGLTRDEFETALGDEWKRGGSKVDWVDYRDGRISKDLAKPSRPARAYFHLTGQHHLATLAEKVRSTTFQDAKNTTRDAALIAPPSVEFAPYNRIPSGRVRRDARQGTIDQDPDFIAFLESLTTPIAKPASTDNNVDGNVAEKEKVTTTPLIEHIREMKAKKDKPAAAKSAKHSRHASKESTAEKAEDKKTTQKPTQDTPVPTDRKQGRLSRTEKEKATKEAVKVLNKEAPTARQNSPATAATIAAKPSTPPAAPAAERRRERGSARLAAQMVQRDLGLGGASPRPRRSATPTASSQTPEQAASTPSSAPNPEKQPENQPRSSRITRPSRGGHKPHASPLAHATTLATPADHTKPPTDTTTTIVTQSTPSKKPPASPQPPPKPIPTGPSHASPLPPRGPRNSPRPPSTPTATASPATANNSTSSSTALATSGGGPNPTTPFAFLKHANPSQGITEPLLHTALSAFDPAGGVRSVEIDKRKGFAYAEFASVEGLRAAMRASPVKVAEGGVVVLERRDGGGAGGGGGGGGGAGPAKGGVRGGGDGGGGGGRGGGMRGGGMVGRGRGRGGGALARGGVVRGHGGAQRQQQQQQPAAAGATSAASSGPASGVQTAVSVAEASPSG
ncbi:MAG: hypothetical protein M1822_001811 [Bathelium mastoideum]|nr:MAG: hypothetical protein M1822_001811 [Bathelium mastoideum]